MEKGEFYENVVIITGASSGIGRELALVLAEQGAWLALAARRVERLEELKKECEERGGRAIVVQMDVTDPVQCKNLVDRTVETFGRIDTLVNNAGRSMWSRFEDLQTFEPLHNLIQINYFGSAYCTYYALPYLKKTRGRLVAVSSMTGKTGVPMRSGYAASKHAIVGFFDTLRIELEDAGVSVTIVYPDFVATETRFRAFGSDGKAIGESHVQESKIMSAEACARQMAKSMASRRREDIMSLRGKVGLWLKVIAPKIVDNIARGAIKRGK
jgi:short-subunit dehydrogenase